MSASFGANVVLCGGGYKDIVDRVKSFAPRGFALDHGDGCVAGCCGSGTGDRHSLPVSGGKRGCSGPGFSAGADGGADGGAAMTQKACEDVGLEQSVELAGQTA
jgi:hypothetical protein